MKRFIPCILAALIIILAFPYTVFADSNAISTARNGVVRILILDKYGKPVGTGSGFAVGVPGEPARIFVTNNHVASVNPNGVFIVLDYLGKGGAIIQAKVLTASKSPDLAILSVDKPIKERTPLPLLSSKYVKAAEEVYALGFPGSADNVDDNGSSLPSTIDDITITKGIISKIDVVSEGAHCYQTDASINGGNSGGPLIDSDGNVIGINTFYALVSDGKGGSKDAHGTNGAIHIDYIMETLDKNNIKYTKGNGSSTPPKEDAPTGPAQPEPSATPSKGGVDKNTIIIIAVIAGGIGVAAIVFKKRKGKTPESPVDRPASLVDFSMPSSQLMCIQGSFEGSVFPINRSITIGRDPKRCQIVFPESTQGISSLHCEVQVDGGRVMLVDRGSSYGTYVSGGIKLTPNQPHILQRGDTFYLASHKNQFKLM